MSSAPPADADCEVLVVGAGPTGLMAADLLQRRGVAVRIVERRVAATRESRAFAVQARSLELLHSLKLADAFLSSGVRVNGVNLHVRGRGRGGPDFARAAADDTPFPFILMIPQSKTESILSEDCALLGVRIERGVTVVAVRPDTRGVTTQVVTREGERTIRSAYVIGADGSHSVVRRDAGLGWHGEALPQRFLLADCKVDWPLDHGSFRVFLNGGRIGLFLPLDGARLSRVMTTDLGATDHGNADGDEDASQSAPLDLAVMQTGLANAVALPVMLSNPVWLTRYRAHHRFTDRYRAGRIFLAGDAAHIHSPAGGQGMNTGLQDAANLAWKLAEVLRRGAGDALLDSYDAERRPVGEAVVRSTGRLFAAAAGQAGVSAWIRDRMVSTLLPLITRAPPFHRKAFFRISQRAIAYPRGAFVAGSDSHQAGPGMRAPDAALESGRTLFGLLAGYRFGVLVLAHRILSVVEQAEIREALDDTARCCEATAQLIAHGAAEAALFERYGVAREQTATLLVRPDGYVAWRSAGLDLDGCREFLSRLGQDARPARGNMHAAA